MPAFRSQANSILSDTKCFKIFSNPLIMVNVVGYELLEFIYDLVVDISHNPVRLTMLAYNLFNPNQIYYPRKSATISAPTTKLFTKEDVLHDIEEELVECGKSVWAGNQEETLNYYNYLKSR